MLAIADGLRPSDLGGDLAGARVIMTLTCIARRALLAPAFLFVLSLPALCQVTWTKGVPVKAGRGIKVTVAEIMSRPVNAIPYSKVIKETEDEGPDRENLIQNPGSADVSAYPPSQDPTAGQFRSTGPLFSLGQSWLGPIGGGTGSESPYVPPDTMGDVSPTQVFVVVNGRFKVYDRNGNLGPLNTDPNTFFASVRSASMSDPRVRWDRLTQRWYVVMIDVLSSNNRICIAVSNGPTITSSSSFTFYQFSYAIGGGNSARFFDYPTIGIDSKAIYIGGNIFGSSFTGCDLFVVNKASLLSGSLVVTPFRDICTAGGAGVYTPHGCDNDDPTANEGYVVGVSGNSFGLLKLRKVSDPGGSPSISSDFNITVPSTANPRSVVAMGSTGNLDGLDDRLFAAKIFWNRETNLPSIWTAHNIRINSTGIASTTGDRDGTRWYEIRGFTGGGSPSLFQSGTVFSNASGAHSYWIPSIAMNGQGHALIGSSYAGTTSTPNVATSDRLAASPLGQTTAPQLITSSTSTYNRQSSTQRWGDYSHTAIDPVDGMSFWTFQEYCSATNQWGIRVARLLAPAPTVTGASPNNAYPFQTVSVTVTGTGLFEPGPSYPNHLTASVSGGGFTVNSVTWNSSTSATVSLTLAGNLLAGSRTLTLTNPDGQSASTSFNVNARVAGGTVTLGDFLGSPDGTPITVEILDPGSNVVQVATTSLDASGQYQFAPTIAPGVYTVAIKAGHWLRKKATNVSVTPAGFTVNCSLVNGDVNNDNMVSISDFNVLRTAFGSTEGSGNWNPDADLNGDGTVSLLDFLILRSHFGQSGD